MTTATQTPSLAISRGLGTAYALPLLLVGPFISVFDQFVVNLAAPSIATSLALSGFAYQALVGGYALAFGLGLLMAGRLGDLIGRRRAYVVGLCSFAVTTMLCGLASDATMLGISRLLQGGSAAIMLPQVLALIRTQFTEDRDRGRALSWFSVAISSGIVLGQLCGGLIPQADIAGLGWRPIFFVAVPICLAAALLVPRRVTAGSPAAGRRPGLDLVGLVLSFAGLAGVLVPLAAFRQIDPWPDGAGILAAGLVLLAMFARWQRRREAGARSTLVPPAMMANRGFLAGLTVNVLLYASVLPTFTVISLFLQRALDLSAGSAALAFVPLGLATALGSWVARVIGPRHGAVGLVLGCAASLAGLTALFVLFDAGTHELVAVEIALVAFGLGNGVATPLANGVPMRSLASVHAGPGGAVIAATQQVSAAFGLALAGLLLFRDAGATALGFSALWVQVGFGLALVLMTSRLAWRGRATRV